MPLSPPRGGRRHALPPTPDRAPPPDVLSSSAGNAPGEGIGSSRLPFLTGAALLGLAVAACWLGEGAFLGFAAGAAAIAAMELARSMLGRDLAVQPWLVVAGALAFPLAAFRWGEAGLMLAAAAMLVALAVPPLVRGLRPGALASAAATLFGALYVGFLGSYAVLVRGADRGALLLPLLAGLVGLFHLGRAFGRRGAPPGEETLRGPVAGIGATLVGGLGAALLLDPPFDPGPMAGLGLSVGLASSLGGLAGTLVRADLGVADRDAAVPGRGGLLARLEALLLAAPAFFYAFKLYLT